MFKRKPVTAAANPEYELSNDTTTGISAPPIGTTNKMPNNKHNEITIIKAIVEVVENIRYEESAIIDIKQIAVIVFWKGYIIALPLINSCNFKKAIILPENVTNPINTLKDIIKIGNLSGVLLKLTNSALAINAEAEPPNPLKIATI